MTLTMPTVTRAEWGAKLPKYRTFIHTPTPEAWLHHSASSGSDAATVRAIQDFHMADPPAGRGWSDVAYTHLLDDDEDPQIFEGRGWGVYGGHTLGHNDESHALCVIGNFNSKPPKDATLENVALWVAYAKQEGHNATLLSGGHRDTRGANPGDCPGDYLYALIPEINARAQQLLDGDDMPDPKIPRPAYVTEAIIADLLAAGVLTTVPANETEDIWRTYVFLHRLLGNVTSGGVPKATFDSHVAVFNQHRHPQPKTGTPT